MSVLPSSEVEARLGKLYTRYLEGELVQTKEVRP